MYLGPLVSLSRNRDMHQARTGFFAYIGKIKRKAKEETVSFHSHLASFFRFMAANLRQYRTEK